MLLGRRGFVVGGVALGLGLAAPSRPRGWVPRLVVERLTVRVPGLDPAHDGLRIVQLSDLHAGRRTPDDLFRNAIAQANALAPDAVVLTGDYVCHSRREVGKMRELVAGLTPPTFAVLGNHDVWVDPAGITAALRGHGYEVLENAWTTIRLRGAPLTVMGVGDALTGREDVPRAAGGLAGAARPLVLTHGPGTADRLRQLRRPLVCVAGHTHGGLIHIPLLTPMVFRSLAGASYVRGRYRVDDVELYVNRGIGSAGVQVRVNSPPEVTLLTVQAA